MIKFDADATDELDELLDALHGRDRGAQLPGHFGNGVARICAWCPGFNRRDPRNAHATHTMCPACVERMNKELDNA